MQKLIWTNSDNFDTIREKILSLKGKQVFNKLNEKEPFTIFDVGNIEQMELNGIWGENFNIPMWGFFVDYGHEDNKSIRLSMKYNFMIPRKGEYNEDLKNCGIVVDNNHPFVIYELSILFKGDSIN